MRVRNNKNQIFEKAYKTERPILFFGYFLFLLMHVAQWGLMYGLWTETGSVIGSITLGSIISLVLYFVFRTLTSGEAAEKQHDKKYTPLKKGRKHDFLMKSLNNIQAANNSNYYSNKSLETVFKKQVSRPFLWTIFLTSFLNLSLLYSYYISNDFLILTIIISLIAPVTCIFCIMAYEHYGKVKKMIQNRKVIILRKNVGSYYIHHDWIYFY